MKKLNMKFVGIVLFLSMLCMSVSAVELDSKNRDSKYVQTILERTSKIIVNLNLKDTVKVRQVTNIVANKYFKLNDIYARRDSLVAVAKADTLLSKELKSEKISFAQNEKDAALYRSHFAFDTDLSLYLKPKQIEIVKDGLTYNVVAVTNKATLEMIPSLKAEEKTQILAWLKEAREFAIDAENSNKKHEAFGKYKGRINNYLSKRGYNLVKEREEWYKRIELKKKAN
jgi:hypothetical protein